MKKTAIILNVVFLLSLFIIPQTVLAAEGGEATAQVLQMGAGSRLPAMGGAGQASVRGPAALHYNPAGLAFSSARELEFTYQELVEDISYGNVDYTRSMGERTWAGGIRYISYGSEEETDWENGSAGDDLKTVGSFDGSDIVASGGVGGKLNPNLSWGLAARLIRLEIADETANGASLDGGLQWKPGASGLPVVLGMAIRNFGPDLKFVEKDEELPLEFSGGASLFLEPLIEQNIVLHTDLEYNRPNSEAYLRAGGEWKFHRKMFAVRLGYDGGLEVDDGLTFGFGVNLPGNNMSFDYSLVPYGDFGDVHRLAFNYYFDAQ